MALHNLQGHTAENKVADYLITNGYKILDQNWRTKICEIDIVASSNEIVYFIEVKYRSSNQWGDGLDYITPDKLNRMTRASQVWLNCHIWNGETALAVAAVNSDGQIKFREI